MLNQPLVLQIFYALPIEMECQRIRLDLTAAGFRVPVDFDNRFEMQVLYQPGLFQAGGVKRHEAKRQNMERIHIHLDRILLWLDIFCRRAFHFRKGSRSQVKFLPSRVPPPAFGSFLSPEFMPRSNALKFCGFIWLNRM